MLIREVPLTYELELWLFISLYLQSTAQLPNLPSTKTTIFNSTHIHIHKRTHPTHTKHIRLESALTLSTWVAYTTHTHTKTHPSTLNIPYTQCTHTHTCTRRSKAYGGHAEHSYCTPGKSSWGRASNLQEDCPGLMAKDSWAFTSPVYTRYPLMVSCFPSWH